MDLEYLTVAINCTIDDFETGIAKAEKGLVRLAEGAKAAGEFLTRNVSLPLAALGGASLKFAGDLDALARGFKAVYKGTGDVNAELAKTKELAKLPGLGLEEAVKGSIRLQAVGFSAEQARKAIQAFGAAVAASGGGRAELDSITRQLGQLAAKGKVLSQDLRPILEAAPLAATALKKLYGTVDSSDIQAKLEAQGKSSQDFINLLINELSKMPAVTSGLNNSFENFGDSVKKSLAAVGDGINKTFNVAGKLDSLGAKLESLADGFNSMNPAMKAVVLTVAGLAAAAGPVLVGLGALGAVVPNVVEGYKALKASVDIAKTALAGFSLTTAGVIVAVGALAAGLIYLAGASQRNLQAYQDQAKSAKDLDNSITPLLNRYDSLQKNTHKTAEEQAELKSIVEKVTAALPAAGTQIDAYGKYLGIATGKARELVEAQLKLTRALAVKSLPDQEKDLAKAEAYNKVLRQREEYYNRTGKFKQNIGLGLTRDYKPSTENVEDFRVALEQSNVELIKQQQLVAQTKKDAKYEGYNAFVAAEQARLAREAEAREKAAEAKEANNLNTIAKLKAKIDELTKQRDEKDVIGSAEYKKDDAEIKRLQAYLDSLTKVKKKTDELAKAFKEIQDKLAGVDTRKSIGAESNYDAAIDKIKILKAGIEDVTEKGATSSNPKLLGLQKQLADAELQLKKLFANVKFEPKADVDFSISDFEFEKIKKELDAANLKAKLQFELDGDSVKYAQAQAENLQNAVNAAASSGVNIPQGKGLALDAGVARNSAANLESLQQYKQGLQEVSAELEVYGNSFNAAGAEMQVVGQRLKDLIQLNRQGTPEFERLTEKFKELKKAAEWDDIKNNIASGLGNLVAEAGTIIFDNVADIIAGNETAQEGLENIFTGILGAFGGFIQDLGKMLVQWGILELAAAALESLGPAGAPAAIAIGLAAIAVGAAFKSASKASARGSGSSSGAGYVSSAGAYSSPSSSSSSKELKYSIDVNFSPIILRADGADLRATSQVDSYRLRRRR